MAVRALLRSKTASIALRALSATALALALLGGGAAAWRAADRDVEVVRIGGDLSPAERSRVRSLIAARLPAGVLSLDLVVMRRTLAAESWVASARVRRRPPATLEVDVVKETALARWRDGSLLSSRGTVIRGAPADAAARTLPQLAGPEGSASRVMAQYRRISELMRAHGVTIARLELDAERGWRFTTGGGLEVVLGDSEVVDRLRRVAAVVGSALSQRLERVARIDARYANGVAVAWREAPAPAEGDRSTPVQLARQN